MRATMQLAFEGGALPPNQIEVSIEGAEKRTLAGEASVADQLAVELKKKFNEDFNEMLCVLVHALPSNLATRPPLTKFAFRAFLYDPEMK